MRCVDAVRSVNRISWLVVACAGLVPNLAAESALSLPAFFIEDSPSHFLGEAAGMHAEFSRGGVEFRAGVDPVRVRFLGASARVRIAGGQPAGQANFLIGKDPSAWRTGLPAYREIFYRQLYPGIDLVYLVPGGQLKSEFRVAPGADPRLIRIEYSVDLAIDAHGCLHAGNLLEKAPVVYQETASGRVVSIEGHYRLLDARTVGFAVSPYDPALPLVIDPTISYSTYLGGTGLGAVNGVAVDSTGSVYATGWTEALNFPVVGPMQATNHGGVDAFVVKVNSTGSALIYASYIGGLGADEGTAIAVDTSGRAHVVGWTQSSNFPLASPMQSFIGGSQTAFVLELNAAGNGLVFSTYLGGSTYDTGTAVAVDAAGNTYVAGDTQSSNFPILNGPQITFGGATDAFVSKLTPAGALAYSTYLGGTAADHAGGIAVDSSGNMYVAGGTYSVNFPIVAGAIQPANGGSQDAFVVKLAAAGSTMVYGTYLGGNGTVTPEQASAIAVDASGNAYVTGVTNSANFPVTAGAYQTDFVGLVSNAFVTKINVAGSALVYSTYLGGSDFDRANGIGLDSAGNAYVAGYTSSVDFPVVNGVQASFGGLYDAFVSKIGPTGSALPFSTYFGGSGSDTANALGVDVNGNMFVGGQTNSVNLPLVAPLESLNNGGSVGWLARLGVTAAPPQLPSVTSVTPPSGSGNAAVFTASYADTGGATALTTVSLLVNAGSNTSFACYVSYNRAANVFTLANDNPGTSKTVVPGGGTVQNSQCQLIGAGSSASSAGNTLTVTVSLTFFPGFAGPQTVYLYAADSGANTGFVSEGAWTVSIPLPQPSVGTVSPNAGSGPSQTFTFVFTDSQNAANITSLGMLFAPSLTFSSACSISVNPQAGTVGLTSDSGLTTATRLLGSSTTLQNSQCAVGASSIAVSGLSDILSVSVTFAGVFDGVQNIYMYAADGSTNTGWAPQGTFFVLAGGVPVANSVVPASGSGPAARFTFTVSDAGGYQNLSGMEVLINSSQSTLNACYLIYDRIANTVALAYPNPAEGNTPVVPGSSTVAVGSECELNGANSTVIFGATSIVLTLDLYFNSAYFGAQNVYLRADESTTLNSGWGTVGTWAVTGGTPSAVSVSPPSGSGLTPAFIFTVSDSSAQYNISGMSILMTPGAPTSFANACYLVFNRTAVTIGLYDNTGTVLTTKGIGSTATLQNSQCAVGYTVVYFSGTSVMLTLNLVFTSTFAGVQTVYLQATEPGSNSGWVERGTWTVP